MTMSPQAQSVAYQACLDETFRQCPLLMGRWCSSLAGALHERSVVILETAEKHALQHAIASLRKHQSALEQGFAGELIKAMAQDTHARAAKKSDRVARPLSSVSFDELELMGDGQVQDVVDSARLQQTVRLACEAGLAGFSARMSTAQGFTVVRADRNPLRPEIVSQAFFKLLQVIPADSGARTRWLTHGGQLLGDALQLLYGLLEDLLAGQGIAPAAYGVISAPGRNSEKAASPERRGTFPLPIFSPPFSAPDARQPAATDPLAPAGRKPRLTLDHLHHLLVGDYDDAFKGVELPSGFGSADTVNRDFSHTIPASMDVLAELQEQGISASLAQKSPRTPPLPLLQLRAQLQTEAKSLGQSLSIEVVGLMIEQIVQDSRLLLPVRLVVADAEPAFLRLAVTDPRFFTDKRHPARRLLEVITNASLAYASENAAGFDGFMQDLHEVAALLTEEHASDAQHFATLLEYFEHRQASHTLEHRESQSRAVHALLQAEQRNLLAEKIAAEIRGRPDFVAGNRIVTAFLTGPWAQVMARERLLGAYGGPGSPQAVFGLALGEVLWSLDVAQASRHRKRFLQIIPGMLKSLREGLLSIDYPLEQSRPFFDELMVIHQAGLASQSGLSGPDAPSAHGLEAVSEEPDFRRPWLAPSEARQSGFMEDEDMYAKPMFEPTQPDSDGDEASLGEVLQPESEEGVALRLGAWVELLVDLQWLRAQLTWVSPYNTLYMFTGEGGRKHSMTSHILQHMLALGLVKVVSQQGVLEGALDSVARAAMRNSVDDEREF